MTNSDMATATDVVLTSDAATGSDVVTTSEAATATDDGTVEMTLHDRSTVAESKMDQLTSTAV